MTVNSAAPAFADTTAPIKGLVGREEANNLFPYLIEYSKLINAEAKQDRQLQREQLRSRGDIVSPLARDIKEECPTLDVCNDP